MIKILSTTSLALVAILLSSCTNSIQERITGDPYYFYALSEEHKRLVKCGKICNGMRKKAVRIAWGDPSTQIENNDNTSEWNYSRSVLVDSENKSATPFDFIDNIKRVIDSDKEKIKPQTVYINKVYATVKFKNRKVISWNKTSSFWN